MRSGGPSAWDSPLRRWSARALWRLLLPLLLPGKRTSSGEAQPKLTKGPPPPPRPPLVAPPLKSR